MDNHLKLMTIKQLISELQHSIEKLDKDHQQIYRIDLDLVLEKIRRIYDEMYTVKPQGKSETSPQVNEIKEQEAIKEIQNVDRKATDSNVRKEELNEPDQPVEITGKPIQKNEENIFKDNSGASMDLFSGNIAQEKTVEKNIIIENTGMKPVEIVAEKFGKRKISGLNQAIGINEKFYFINELFDGNMKEYKISIDTLDQAENIESAHEFLESLAIKKNWDKSCEAFKMILDFTERKFS